MAKQVLQVDNFAGGLNAYSDARDIEDNEFAQNWNAVVSKQGIIKVAGMALPEIETDYITNENFQDGVGLFQFSSDYSISTISGSFDIGLTKGTRVGTSSTTAHSLENKESLSATDDFYNGMIMFIYEGTGIGESRIITDYDYTGGASERLLTTEAFSVSLDTTSKYIIYAWKLDGTNWAGKNAVAKKDFITNAISTSMLQNSIIAQLANLGVLDNKYFIFSRKNNITDEQSSNLGYIELASSVTLIPGTQYILSFDCAAKQPFHNLISDGDVDPSDGGTSYGDKVPWIQLHSTSVADTKGSIRGLSATQVTTSDTVSGAWTDGTHTEQSPSSSSGEGTGATFNIVVSASGTTLNFHICNRGSGYVDNETLTFVNPDGTGGETATITIDEINVTGLSLYANNQWKSGIVGDNATSKYISYVDHNYIDNGDFADFSGSDITGATNNGWTVGANATAVKESVETNKYGGHDGTLSLKRNTGTSSLEEPEGDSYSAYIYQNVTLDENTTYHLNFLYDAINPSGVWYFVYNVTQSVYAIIPEMLPNTRQPVSITNSDIPVYQFAKSDYITFNTGHALKNSTTANQKEEFRIGFASHSSIFNLPFDNSVRIAGVTLYKGHNDLVSMSNSLNETTSNNNPYSDNIKSFSNYSTFITVPENYTTATDWTLRLHAGQYGFRNNNTLGFANSQEIYFDNILLSEHTGVSTGEIGNVGISEGAETITAISNNTSLKSEIVLHSSKSNTLHKNKIHWNGINCQPVFNYINGFLKISDGNFNNNNNNKLFFYTNKTSLLTNFALRGWTVKNQIFDNDISFNINPNQTFGGVVSGENYIGLMNTRYFDNFGDPTNADGSLTNIAINTTLRNQNAGAHAAWYGSNNIQGYVHMYYFDSRSFYQDGPDIYINNIQAMIPRVHNSNASHWNEWLYRNIDISEFGGTTSVAQQTVQQSGPLASGGYKEALQTNIYTGDIDNNNDSYENPGIYSSDYINYPRLNTYSVNRTNGFNSYATAQAKAGITKTQFAVQMNVSENNSFQLDNARVQDLTLEWAHEVYGEYGLEGGGQLHFPHFEVKIDIIENANNTILNLVDDLNINRRGYNDLILNTNHTIHKTYGKYHEQESFVNENINYSWGNTTFDTTGINPDSFINSAYETGEVKEAIFDVDDEGTLFYKMQLEDTIDVFSNSGITFGTNTVVVVSIESVGNNSEGNGLIRKTIIDPLTLNPQEMFIDIHKNTYILTNTSRFQNKSFYNRTKLHNFSFNYVDANLPITTSGSFVNFNWDSPIAGSSSTWGNREFKLAYTTTNQFDEESNIISFDNKIGGFLALGTTPIISVGHCPTIELKFARKDIENEYNKKINFYMKDTTSEMWYKQFYIDLETKRGHSTTSGIYEIPVKTSNYYEWTLKRENLLEYNEVNSYESESMVSQNDAFKLETMTARYKHSIVANNRLYAGNVKQNGRIYGDRMLKSPVGKYNILPASNFIDVAINDGDEITALEYYKDKILQFKKRKVFVINISGDFEFLEQTFDNVGVLQQCSVVKTPYGIVWANKSGCYLYDGEKIKNLIDNKIPVYQQTGYNKNYWRVETFVPVIAYSQKDDIIYIRTNSKSEADVSATDAYTYHFPTKSWLFNHKSIQDTNTGTTGSISNMITNKDGDIIFYNGTYNGIKKLYYEPKIYYDGADAATGFKVFAFSTKEFTFGNVANKKKIYKIYVTYRTTSGADSKILVKTGINGAVASAEDGTSISTSSKFSGTSTACYHHTNGLLDTSGAWKTAELKFTNPGNFSKINSLQLQFYSVAVDKGFEINDISISFRIKRVK